ncbi:tyrosine protein phosphatase [Metabacillus sp. GX 13764]|uniref:tyrosine-protein phosphatase n=1 Tax=Metabacillus kandeliae TaxID=2900151 RepID=UPI001E5A97D5|nr:tyrosine protein phosphatase [Metabacillus kandeliae]
MIDIHSHILPGVDDGAQSLEDALQMARAAVNEGITKLVASPHHQNGAFNNDKSSILANVESLNIALQKEKIPLEILPGQETRIYGELLEDLATDVILPVNNSNYLLIELPSGHVPRYTEQLLFDLQLKGYTPVIVHPERNAEIIENPDILYNLVKKGTLTQVTAGSLTGHFGKKIKKFSLDLVEAQLTHLIASDAHNTNSRSFRWNDALSVLNNEFGVPASYYFFENSDLLIRNQTLIRQTPERIKRKKFLGMF